MKDSSKALHYIILRVSLSLIFVVSGLGHLIKTEVFVEKLQAGSIGLFLTSIIPGNILILLSGLALFFGGLMLMTGVRIGLASFILIATLVPITLAVQIGKTDDVGPLFKNISLLGGLIFFFVEAHHKRNSRIEQKKARRFPTESVPSLQS